MSAQQATAEKSMEEILASIRRTIENDVHKNQQGGHMSEQGTNQANEEDVFELTQVVNEDGSVSEVATSEAIKTPDDFSSEEVSAEAHHDEATHEAEIETSVSGEDASPERGLESHTQTSEEALDQLDQRSATVETPTQEKTYDASPTGTENSQTEAATVDSSPLAQETEELISETVAQMAGQALSDLSKAVETSSQTPSSEASTFSGLSSKDLGQSTVEGLMRELLRPMLKDWLDAHLPSLVKWIVTEQIEKIIQEKKKN